MMPENPNLTIAKGMEITKEEAIKENKGQEVDINLDDIGVPPEEQEEFHKEREEEQKRIESKNSKTAKKHKDGENPIVRIGRILIDEYHIKTPEDTDTMYLYMRGYYNSINSEKHLRTKAKSLLCNYYSSQRVRDIISYVKDSTYYNLPEDYTANCICLKNGILSLETFELEKSTPQLFITHKINVDWNPDADTSKWEDYIDSLVNDIRYAQTIQEYVGYTFEKFQIAKKLLYIHGLRDSGKSTLFSILLRFFNEGNCSQLTLYQLCQRFLNAEIHGKLANIRADMDYKLAPKSMSIIKSLTGDDIIAVERKFKDPFSFRNKAKIYLSGNGVPAIPEKGVDDAFYNRWIPIEFPNTFESNRGASIKSKFTTPEAQSAILKWAIDGLKRLKKNNWQFTYCPSVKVIRDWFAEELIRTPIEKYLENGYVPVPDHFELKSDMYEDYLAVCERRDIPALAENAFHRSVGDNRVYAVQEFRPTIDGKQVRTWKGIELVK